MKYFLHLNKIESPEEARDLAIDWQNWQADQHLSIGELSEWHEYFTNLATEFDLREEFTENGII